MLIWTFECYSCVLHHSYLCPASRSRTLPRSPPVRRPVRRRSPLSAPGDRVATLAASRASSKSTLSFNYTRSESLVILKSKSAWGTALLSSFQILMIKTLHPLLLLLLLQLHQISAEPNKPPGRTKTRPSPLIWTNYKDAAPSPLSSTWLHVLYYVSAGLFLNEYTLLCSLYKKISHNLFFFLPTVLMRGTLNQHQHSIAMNL